MNKTELSFSNLRTNIDNNLESLGFSQNYSLLLSQLEKLASSISPEFQQHALGIGDYQQQHQQNQQQSTSSGIISDDTTTIIHHGITDAEYSRFISDVWIGIVLTLLILSIIFFICSCFLYHKFQQWKNSYRTNNPEPEIIRRYDIDVESLPSYTLVSGLPTYDDALEQFRKSAILFQQPSSVIKFFENYSNIKQPLTGNGVIVGEGLIGNNANVINATNDIGNSGGGGGGGGVVNNGIGTATDINNDGADSISINSCSCGGSTITTSLSGNHANGSIGTGTTLASTLAHSTTTLSTIASVIELSPEQLKLLSKKRLSLQISLSSSSLRLPNTNTNNNNNNISSSSSGNRGRIDLCREVNRSNLLRSHDLPQTHRSTTSLSNERSIFAQRLRNLQHRGSLA